MLPTRDLLVHGQVLDLAAWRAVIATGSLTPLPMQFPNPTLTVHLSFQY